MKLNTAPLIWDLDAAGNVAPTVTPGGSVATLTLNLNNLDGRIDDMYPYVQAIWIRVTFTETTTANTLNVDKYFGAVDSFRIYSPILGDVLAQRSGSGAAVGLIDQVIAGGYKFPTPLPQQVASAAQDNTMDLYYRIPLAYDWGERPQDGGIWAPLFEKGRIDVNMATSGTTFGTGHTLKAAAATVRGWLEVLPNPVPQIHAPWKPVRYEFNTSGTQLKLFSFGNGDGLLGINPGARLSGLYWLSNNNLLGGVDTIDKWSRLSLAWRRQKITVNPEAQMAHFLSYMKSRPAVGSIGSGTVNDAGTWPYQMAGGPSTGGVLHSSGLFFPIVFPGYNSGLSGIQKQVGDLQIDAGFSSNPNGTHVFRAHEHYGFNRAMLMRLIDAMGFSNNTHTCEPKLNDNTDVRQINPRQMVGMPVRILPRSKARLALT